MHARIYAGMREELLEFYTKEEADKWLTSAHKLLGGRRPVDSSPQEVWQIIDQLKSGAYI